jgi:hypothetical protein
MNPFIHDPRRTASALILAAFAILACLYLTSCSAIPYLVSINYGGASASYDGKRVLLDVDGNEVGRSLRGYAK